MVEKPECSHATDFLELEQPLPMHAQVGRPAQRLPACHCNPLLLRRCTQDSAQCSTNLALHEQQSEGSLSPRNLSLHRPGTLTGWHSRSRRAARCAQSWRSPRVGAPRRPAHPLPPLPTPRSPDASPSCWRCDMHLVWCNWNPATCLPFSLPLLIFQCPLHLFLTS